MILLLFIFFNISLHPQYYTNHNYYYELTGRDSLIYGATNGGAVRLNYLNNRFRVLTNTDGLPVNRQNCIALDSSGYVWVGSEMGLAQIDPTFNTLRMYPMECLPCLRILRIFCLKDTIYISSASGLLAIYTQGTSQNFTDDITLKIYDANGLPSNNVLCVAVDTMIWVGTDNGIARFTKDFQYFTQYTMANGLLSNYINTIEIIDSFVYVGTDRGLNHFSQNYFDTLLVGLPVRDIESWHDSLLLVLDSLNQFGIFLLSQETLIIKNNGLPGLAKIYNIENINDNWFLGIGNRWIKDYFGDGIGWFDFNGGIWTTIRDSCLPSNHISDIATNENGVFVAHGARSSLSMGIGWLDKEGRWHHFTNDSVLPTNHIHRCETSPDGRVWFGINAISNSGKDTILAFSFEPANSKWQFIKTKYNGMDNTDALWDLKLDKNCNLYVHIGRPSNRLWVIDSALAKVYALEPIREGFYIEIAIDTLGRIWRTIFDAGLVMTDTKNTPFERSDDYYNIYSESNGLISNYLRGCIIDDDNNLYAACVNGLLIYNGVNFLGITEPFKNTAGGLFDVELDSEGRVWILASDGVYWYDPRLDFIDEYKFSANNIDFEFLPLSWEIIQIQGFKFDPVRRCLWLGCEKGLLKFEIEYDSVSNLDSILIYPNPVVGVNIVRIKNIPLDAEVHIYSISGRLIAKDLLPDKNFGEVVWEIPDNISSGLYFALVKSTLGKKVCKFAIVR